MVATPRDVSSERDVNQTFNCSALGGPGNRFTWTRLLDGEVVSQMSSLTVLVDAADKGSEYHCTVENDAGNDTDNVTLRGMCVQLLVIMNVGLLVIILCCWEL